MGEIRPKFNFSGEIQISAPDPCDGTGAQTRQPGGIVRGSQGPGTIGISQAATDLAMNFTTVALGSTMASLAMPTASPHLAP